MSALNLNWATLNLAAATISAVNKEAGTATIEIEGVKLAVEFGIVEGGDRKGGCYITKFGHDCLVLCDGRRIQIGKGWACTEQLAQRQTWIASGVASLIKSAIAEEGATAIVEFIDALYNKSSVEYNSDLDGFIVEFGGRTVQVQFEGDSNRISADFGLFFPHIDKVNGYGYDLNEEEEEIFSDWMHSNSKINAHAKHLDELEA